MKRLVRVRVSPSGQSRARLSPLGRTQSQSDVIQRQPNIDEPRPADAGYSSYAQPVTGPAFPARAAGVHWTGYVPVRDCPVHRGARVVAELLHELGSCDYDVVGDLGVVDHGKLFVRHRFQLNYSSVVQLLYQKGTSSSVIGAAVGALRCAAGAGAAAGAAPSSFRPSICSFSQMTSVR